jgi:hypothetical protein
MDRVESQKRVERSVSVEDVLSKLRAQLPRSSISQSRVVEDKALERANELRAMLDAAVHGRVKRSRFWGTL